MILLTPKEKIFFGGVLVVNGEREEGDSMNQHRVTLINAHLKSNSPQC